MNLPLSCLIFYFILHISYCEELPVKYVSLRTVDSLGRTIPRPLLTQQNFRNFNGPIILKRDIPNNVLLVQSDFKRMPSIKTASLDEFYDTKEFNDLLKEYKLNIEKNKLPDIRDVAAFLGTSNSEETYKEIRDFASTEDGLDIIKSYFEQNSANDRMDDIFNIQPKASMFHSSDSDYKTNTEHNENGSWWDKLIKWFGLSQSTKIDSVKNDVDIFSTTVPISNSVPKNVKYIGNVFKPSPNTEIPINPPFKVFNSHSINLNNQPYTVDVKMLPTIRLTEHQYDEMMKSVNLNSQKLARNEAMRRAEDSSDKEFIEDKFIPSEIKRSFSTQSQPMRHTSYDLPTGSHYKANPDYIDKISKILSEKLDDKRVVSAVSDLTVQQHSQP